MRYQVTPSRLDGLGLYGQKSGSPFGPRGNAPSFFGAVYFDSREAAEWFVRQIEARNDYGRDKVWTAYVSEIREDEDGCDVVSVGLA